MLSNSVIVVAFILLLFFMYYKRNQLKQMFFVDVVSPATQIQEKLEQTADIVIKRLEEQIINLEFLIVEANEKITSLDMKIKLANETLNKENKSSEKSFDTLLNDVSTTNLEIVSDEIAILSIDQYKEMTRSDKRSSIIEMADLGYDITEMAQTTGLSKGEIMLLLQLNKK